MKKILAFLIVIVVIFAGIILLNRYQTKELLKDNPYGTDDLKQETIDLLKDPNYKNIILPDDLDKKLENGESQTVYFFSPTCSYCRMTTPIVVPLAEDLGIDLKLFNLLEFESYKTTYDIQYTPTIVHYENGEEKARIVGYDEEDVFKKWFEENVLN